MSAFLIYKGIMILESLSPKTVLTSQTHSGQSVLAASVCCTKKLLAENVGPILLSLNLQSQLLLPNKTSCHMQ